MNAALFRHFTAAIGLATSLATGCAAPTKSAVQSPENSPLAVPPKTPVTAEPESTELPAWLTKELAGIELVRADHATDLVESVHVVISPTHVVADGEEVARVDQIVAVGGPRRIDALFEKMKTLRERFKSAHPGHEFPGLATYWVDARAPALVVKSVFQTCAYAGYPNGNFGVRKRDDPKRFGRLSVDAMVPGPPNTSASGMDNSFSGRLPPEVIQRIVRSNYGALRACYEKALAKKPDLTGNVVVRFVIDREGKVSKAEDSGSKISDRKVVDCALDVYRKLEFPKPEGGTVTVVYPILFSPSD